MSLGPTLKIQELVAYLSTPGKKVVLVGEQHDARNIAELYDVLGKAIHISSESRKLGRPIEFYLESPENIVVGQMNTPGNDPPNIIQANLMRFFTLAKITPNFPGFDRSQCQPSSPPSCRNGDDQYAGDIRRLLGKADIVIAFMGISHIPTLARLLPEFNPFMINTATQDAIASALHQWPQRMAPEPVPDFARLLPVYQDLSAEYFARASISQWNARASSPPRPPRVTPDVANAMSIKQLKAELTLRKISFAGMNEKTELVNALVAYTGGKRRRKTRKNKKRRKTKHR